MLMSTNPAATVPFSSSVHFNSRGELIAAPPFEYVSPKSVFPAAPPIQPRMDPRHHIRLCARYGCNAIIPSSMNDPCCARCQRDIAVLGPDLSSKTTTRGNTSLREVVPPRKEKIYSKPPGGGNVIDFDDLDLLYPESNEEADKSGTIKPPISTFNPLLSTTIPSPTLSKLPADINILANNNPRRDIAPVLSISADSLYTTSPLALPTPPILNTPPRRHVQPAIRLCSTPECNGLLKPTSTSKRCLGCVSKAWKDRASTTIGSVTWADVLESRPPEPAKGAQPVAGDKSPTKLGPAEIFDPCIWDNDLTDLSDSAEDSNATESGRSQRRCTIRKCRRILPADYRWKCCPECRTHYREYQRKRLEAQPRAGDEETVPTPTESNPAPGPMSRSAPRSFIKKYQSLPALLADFSLKLLGFLEAQTFYFSVGDIDHTTTFDFSGELEQINQGMLDIKEEVERVGLFRFSAKIWKSQVPSGAVVSVTPSAGVLTQGELEIAVLEEHSHILFPGQRTIIRLRTDGRV
ncbi:hypothetical protein BD779DRAFT_1534317 [Infundibulicybe gibba]|nr:hypothetical protein BD779DRAFT_1534317 [Infundibulicybe gibba]